MDRKKEGLKENQVVVGSKPLGNYLVATILRFEFNKELEIVGAGSNINKLERIVRLLSNLGVREKERRIEKFNNIDSVVCVLERP
jgi:DNA-binding protein